jgi:hypothetical protein
VLPQIEDDLGPLFHPGELFGELWTTLGYDRRVYRSAGTHPDPRVRLHPARFPQVLDDATRAGLLADPEPEIRETHRRGHRGG